MSSSPWSPRGIPLYSSFSLKNSLFYSDLRSLSSTRSTSSEIEGFFMGVFCWSSSAFIFLVIMIDFLSRE